MRLVLDRRARRLLARLPRYNVYSLAELALLSLLAWQCARLLLTLVTPVGPIGDWRPDAAAAAPSTSILSAFDPFFRLADTGGAVVTGLDLKLFGIRADQASGRGSAIIGLPSGQQSSVSVGEEIMPGVTLKAVAFDHVTILRGGAEEQVFLDQSQPAAVVSPPGSLPEVAVNAPAVAPSGAPVSAAALAGAASFSPRAGSDGINGLTVQPAGDGSVLAATGMQAGDVIVSVNGARVRGVEDAQRIRQQLARGGDAAVVVERGGVEVPLAVRIMP
ncbi:MAG: type II secretion system protein N [Sphingomonas sp.]